MMEKNLESRIQNPEPRSKAGFKIIDSKFWRAILGVLLFSVVITWLSLVFAGQIILNPVAFQVGSLAIHWYGFTMAAAITAAFLLAEQRLVKRSVTASTIDVLLWWSIASGLVGARLGFVVQNLGYFAANPVQILAINQGGLSIHGAVIVAAIAVVVIVRKAKLNFLTIADALTPAVLLGAIIGRFGNFLNYELYGYPTHVIWKMFVPLAYRLPGYEAFSFFHPTFLYELLMNSIVLALVLWYEKRFLVVIASVAKQSSSSSSQVDRHSASTALRDDKTAAKTLFPGTIFFATIAGYSVSRFIVEFFRIGVPIGGGLTLAQWISLVVILIATVAQITRSRTVKKKQP